MKSLLLSTALLVGSAALLNAADDGPVSLYFQKVEPKALTTLSLHIDNDGQVYGNHHWLPKDADGAHGTVDGTLNGDILRVVYSYTIEGSEQSEEQIYKLEGDRLIKGEGDMKEAGDGKSVFRNAAKVTFTGDVLKRMAVQEPKIGSPERKAIMDAMRGPVSKHIGKQVKFTGSLMVYKGWARFSGGVDTMDGKPPAGDLAAGDIELDFNAYLQQDEDGTWNPVHWGFAGDVSVVEDAREKCVGAPWVILD